MQEANVLHRGHNCRPPKVQVLLNDSCHRAAGAVDELSATLVRGFARYGLEAAVATCAGDRLEQAAADARRRASCGEIGAVIAAGGDGTVRTVASALTGSGVPFGVIPLGTLNHFAKDIGLPLELDGAVATIAKGHRRTVDVAEVNGRRFINNSSIGVYPYLVVDRERQRRHRGLSKWTAMLVAVARSIRRLPVHRLRIHAEGDVHEYRSPCVFIGNNEYELEPGRFGTRRTISEGRLCLFIARHESATGLAWLALKSVLGLLDKDTDLRAISASSVSISSRRRRLLVAMDGEVELIRSPLHYRSNSASLLVLAPAPDSVQQLPADA